VEIFSFGGEVRGGGGWGGEELVPIFTVYS